MITAINDWWPQWENFGRCVWLGQQTGHNKGTGHNTFRAAGVSEPLGRRSPSNVARPSSPPPSRIGVSR